MIIGKASQTLRQAIIGTLKRTGKRLQVLGFSGELIDDVPHYQHIGFASDLPKNSELVLLPLRGHSRSFVIIGSQGGAVKIEVNEGETVIYDQFGHEIRLTKTGIKITGDVEITGNLKATGNVSDVQGSMLAMRNAYNPHTHANDGNAPPSTPMAATST